MSVASGPRLPSCLSLPNDLLCSNIPRERLCGLCLWSDTGRRPGRRLLRGLAAGGVGFRLSRCQGLVCKKVLPSGLTALSAKARL